MNDIRNEIKTIWKEWEIEEEIGRGSFGTVYKAVHRIGDNSFYSAVKVIPIPLNDTEPDDLRLEGLDDGSMSKYFDSITDDFIHEIELLEKLKGNSHIVSIEDFEVVRDADGIHRRIYIRMELLKSLNDLLMERSGLDREEVYQLGIDLCEAIACCEKENIIHRDIKQENIFISKHGKFKLGDFGIAGNIGSSGTMSTHIGTYSYMAPEIYKCNSYGSTVDLYSLGMLLYRLTNRMRAPFVDPEKQIVTSSERQDAFLKRITGEELPTPADADPALADIIRRACAYEPADRYQSADEMREALIKALLKVKGSAVTERLQEVKPEAEEEKTDGHSCENIQDTPGKSVTKNKRKKKFPVAIATAVASAACVTLIGFNVQGNVFDFGNSNVTGAEYVNSIRKELETHEACIGMYQIKGLEYNREYVVVENPDRIPFTEEQIYTVSSDFVFNNERVVCCYSYTDYGISLLNRHDESIEVLNELETLVVDGHELTYNEALYTCPGQEAQHCIELFETRSSAPYAAFKISIHTEPGGADAEELIRKAYSCCTFYPDHKYVPKTESSNAQRVSEKMDEGYLADSYDWNIKLFMGQEKTYGMLNLEKGNASLEDTDTAHGNAPEIWQDTMIIGKITGQKEEKLIMSQRYYSAREYVITDDESGESIRFLLTTGNKENPLIQIEGIDKPVELQSTNEVKEECYNALRYDF